MKDKSYWLNVVNDLVQVNKASDAAHVLASNVDILEELLKFLDKKKLISNCLLCYAVDYSAQPYLDEILINFSINDLVKSYKELDKKPIEVAGSLMWLLEDLDPSFSFITS